MWVLSIAYIHVVAGVLLAGYALFWAMLALSLARDSDAPRMEGLLRLALAARWPHVVVPLALRLPLPLVGWTFLVATALTGVLLLAGVSFSGMLLGKLLLFAILLGSQLLLTLRPTSTRAYVNLAVVVLIVAASALLRH
jgi:hypothetical protein